MKLKWETNKVENRIFTTLIILGLAISAISLIVPSTIATNDSTPTYFMEYSNVYGMANVIVPSIGNITSMIVTPVHQNRSSTTDNYNVLSLQLTGPQAAGSLAVLISTNSDPNDIAWRKALVNGSSTYTEVNGNIIINNLLSINSSQLTITKNNTQYTADFAPITPIAATLPASIFPPGNFSSTWTIPSFHVVFNYSTTTQSLGNTTTLTPSGWSESNEYASCVANFTFNCPSWNNFTYSSIGSARTFNVHRGQTPGGNIVPDVVPTKAVGFDSALGIATVDIPKTGNITRMLIRALHSEMSTTSNSSDDFVTLTLSASGFNGTAGAFITTNSNPTALKWTRQYQNGSSVYTELNGNVTINNILQVSANELRVQRNGTHVTIDFSPTRPVNVTLPADAFPSPYFPATWTIPSFHVELDPTSSFTVLSADTVFVSGWVQSNYYVIGSANSTVSIPSLNFTGSATGTSLAPYVALVFTAPSTPVVTTPTPTPTSFSTATPPPTPTPTAALTGTPTPTSTIAPTSVPTVTPSPTSSVAPTSAPTGTHIPTATPKPTQAATAAPSNGGGSTLPTVTTYAIVAAVIIIIVILAAVVAFVMRRRAK
jgi:hypothetical protein